MVRGPQAFTAVRELLLTVLSWAGMREPGNGFLGPTLLKPATLG